jgi:DNA-binding transcriptional LysR family regulator
MKLDPRHLVQLSVIVEMRSFGLAARELGLTQPAISRNIRILEDRLGSPVLVRTRGDIRPTPVGQVLAEHGKVVRHQALTAETFADNVASGAVGEIRIGAPSLLAEYTLAKPLLEFAAARPGLVFRVETGLAPSLLEMLSQGHLDMVIGPIGAVERSSGFLVEQIFRHQSRFYCREGHPIANGPLTAEILAEARWAALKQGSLIRSQMDALLASIGIHHIHVNFECRTEGVLLKAIEMSDMLTVLPGRSRADWIENREIQELRYQHNQSLLPIGVVTREVLPLTGVQEDLRNYLVDHFADSET